MKSDQVNVKPLEIDIIDLNEDGEGVGKHDGFTWFVPNTVPGDRVFCIPGEKKKSYGWARATEWVKDSSIKVDALCPYFDKCGGCQIQNIDYDQQLLLKSKWVSDALTRIGGFDGTIVKPTIGMESPYRYRNKGIYPVKEQKGKVQIGFYEKKSHRVVDIADCLIQHEGHFSIIKAFKHYMNDFKVPAFDERTKKGMIRHLAIRQSDDGQSVMVIVVTYKKSLTMTKALVDLLIKANPKIVSVVQNINLDLGPSVFGTENKILYGADSIVDHLGNLDFRISPLSFFQVNSEQALKLYETALEFASLTGEETVMDLYSGTGTLSLFLAEKAKKVYGVESYANAVNDAIQNAEMNGIKNAEFIIGTAEEITPNLLEAGILPNVVVVDPPRSGCEPEVLESILKMMPERIVYVSCKPSTLARDLKMLCSENLYEVMEVQPVDLFGHSMHV
ncbi:MAG: 23S rRNA (uracil(1939)-C(5))-methyltransferase RlmD, partial [Clostridia bacterium]|nr:23S rRNA (uracil(1939)-C(5))-methyltransferase RlmD [Clostridia bacterium]